MKTTNVWLETLGRRVEKITYDLQKYRMSGSYGGNINLEEIITLFSGAKAEIIRLQKELDELQETIKELDKTDVVFLQQEENDEEQKQKE